MNILVSGSSGLIGPALISLLTGEGHEVLRLVRRKDVPGSVFWDPAGDVIDRNRLEAVDAVVHLAGENIAGRRWTAAQKAKIRDSRVTGTRLLSETLAALERRPQVMVSASAIGYYGDRGSEVLRENSSSGVGFLSDVCRDWEAAADPAEHAGIRVVHPRIGIVLAKDGGALPKMALPFKSGVGGKIGSGRQYMSWIALDDLARVILFCVETPSLLGPVNAVATGTVTNAEFTKVLGRVLSRPTVLPLPAFAAKIAFGEMADALLLASARVEPAKLLAAGFRFRHEDLEEALRAIFTAETRSTQRAR